MRRRNSLALIVAGVYIGCASIFSFNHAMTIEAIPMKDGATQSILVNSAALGLIDGIDSMTEDLTDDTWDFSTLMPVQKTLRDNIRKARKAEMQEAKKMSEEAEKFIISKHKEEVEAELKKQEEERARQEAERLAAEAQKFTPVEKVHDIPSGLGNLHTYTEWDKFNWAYGCKNVINELGGKCKQQAGYITYSPEGFVKYGAWYAGAMTSTFGNVGDMVLIVQDDDTVYPVIIADHKCQTYTSYDNNPANMYGHMNGACMVEFQVTKNNTIYNGSGSNAGPQFAHYIKQVINVGNVYDNKDYIENAVKVFENSSVKGLTFIPVTY